MRLTAFMFLAMLMVGLGGCVNRTPLTMSSESFVAPDSSNPGRKQKPVEKPADACVIRIGDFTDKRRNPDTLGSVAGRPLKVEDLSGLVSRSFEYYVTQSRHFRLEDRVINEGGATPAKTVTVQGDILKAYMHGVATSMVANIAVRLQFVGPEGHASEEVLRGNDTSMNWASGDGELQESMSAAILNVARLSDGWIQRQCRKLESASMANSAASMP